MSERPGRRSRVPWSSMVMVFVFWPSVRLTRRRAQIAIGPYLKSPLLAKAAYLSVVEHGEIIALPSADGGRRQRIGRAHGLVPLGSV